MQLKAPEQLLSGRCGEIVWAIFRVKVEFSVSSIHLAEVRADQRRISVGLYIGWVKTKVKTKPVNEQNKAHHLETLQMMLSRLHCYNSATHKLADELIIVKQMEVWSA